MKLRVEQEGRLYRVALSSPETRNVLDQEGCLALLRAFREAESDQSVGAILLEADGPLFCVACEPHEELLSIGRTIGKPLIASVQGVALGGGLALAANAHVVVAAQGTSFGLTGIREGVWHRAIHQAVARAVGERRAVELSLSGRVFSTPDAVAWGLVQQAAPAFELEDRAEQIASEIANASPEAVREMLKG
ncbi:MAG TPA: enoyl-CoA hydratase/isomerase family protein [Bryobacteraceae bacterium]|nr:enoyl-CoA hydratase/isomerase family protein [Bryobacteraceae bacterium]